MYLNGRKAYRLLEIGMGTPILLHARRGGNQDGVVRVEDRTRLRLAARLAAPCHPLGILNRELSRLSAAGLRQNPAAPFMR